MPCCVVSVNSCGLSSGFGTLCETGLAKRGSLRCLSAVSAGAEAGFLSGGSVALARADNEFTVTVRGEPGVVEAAAGAAGAGVEALATGGAWTCAGGGTVGVVTGAGAGGRGGAAGLAAAGAGAGLGGGAGTTGDRGVGAAARAGAAGADG